jgi:hypothetical protein
MGNLSKTVLRTEIEGKDQQALHEKIKTKLVGRTQECLDIQLSGQAVANSGAC